MAQSQQHTGAAHSHQPARLILICPFHLKVCHILSRKKLQIEATEANKQTPTKFDFKLDILITNSTSPGSQTPEIEKKVMHIFCLVFSKPEKPANKKLLAELARKAGSKLPFEAIMQNVSVSESIEFYSWFLEKTESEKGPAQPFYFNGDRLCAFDGWAIPSVDLASSRPLANSTTGEYLLLEVDSEGTGGITRNKSGIIRLYISDGVNGVAISNSASVASTFANGEARFELSNNFWSSLIGISFPFGQSTAYENTIALSPSDCLKFQRKNISISPSKQSRFFDASMREFYAKNPSKFWDYVYEEMLAEFRMIFSGAQEKTLFLSGGKDSRLMLALVHGAGLTDGLTLKTTGPGYSADVILAKKIADKFELPILYGDNISDENDYFEIAKKHIELVDSSTSPIVPRVWYDVNAKGTPIVGHESGTREYQSTSHLNNLNDFKKHIKSKLNNLDRLSVLSKNSIKKLNEEVEREIEKIFATSDTENLFVDFYATHRVRHYLSSSKYVDRLSSGFAPYPLMTDFPMTVTYNVGQKSRLEEEFHFELIKRTSKWLVEDCPLASIPWAEDRLLKEFDRTGEILPEPIPNYSTLKAPILGGNGALVSNSDKVKDFVLSFQDGPIFDVVERDSLARKLSVPLVGLERDCVFSIIGMLISQSKTTYSDVYPGPDITLRPHGEGATGETNEKLVERRYREAVTDIFGDLKRFSFHGSTIALSKKLEDVGRLEEATAMMERAAGAGNGEAAYLLGRAFWSGKLGHQDPVAAVKWFRAAAASGSIGGQTMLAHALKSGTGCTKNEEEATLLYRKSYDAGDRWTSEHLADLYADRDVESAKAYYEDAHEFYSVYLEQGKEFARPLLDRVENKLKSLLSI